MLSGTASRGKGEEGLTGAGAALPAGAPASFLQVNTPAVMLSGAPAKTPQRGQAEQKLCPPAAGRNAEMVVTEGNAQGQEGMSVSTAPGSAEKGFRQCCLHSAGILCFQPGISAVECPPR